MRKASEWWEGLLRAYRLELIHDERAPRTIRLYLIYLRAFGHTLKADIVTREDLYGWADQLRKTYPNQNTRSLQYSILRRFLVWAAREELVDAKLWMYVRIPRRKRREPRPLPLRDMEVLERHFMGPRPDLLFLRDRALFWFLYQTGSRIGAVLALDRDDLIEGQAIVRQKGGDELRLVAGEKAIEAIAHYMQARRDLHPALFGSHSTIFPVTRVTIGGMNVRWGKLARELGIGKFTNHRLRHTTGTDLRAAGVGIEDIADKLGHKTLDMARSYSAPAEARKREVVRLLEPNPNL